MYSPTILGLLFAAMLATSPVSAELRENIEYGQASGISLRLDAQIPEGNGPFPAAILVHGGGWVRGDRKIDVQPLFKPLTDAGIAWFSISYRLANESANGLASSLLMGEGIDDVRQAIVYVKGHAPQFRIDPDRIALVGESAGAQLASMAALKPESAGPVRAVVAFYSPSDLAALAKNSKRIPESLRQSIEGTPFEDLLVAGLRNLSPINFVRKGMPPFLLVHGTQDSLVPFDQSQRMCERIHKAGAVCDLFPVRGGGHGMRWWESVHLTAYKPYMIEWLQNQLADPRHPVRAASGLNFANDLKSP
jgi:alpha-L-fucosidase 2